MRKYRPRIYYTEADKALMWDRWRKGDSLEKIAQLFDRSHSSVARILVQTGGIQPPKRTRSKRVLSLAEREEISRGIVSGRSLRSIAASLNRAPSTISREIDRNGGRQFIGPMWQIRLPGMMLKAIPAYSGTMITSLYSQKI